MPLSWSMVVVTRKNAISKKAMSAIDAVGISGAMRLTLGYSTGLYRLARQLQLRQHVDESRRLLLHVGDDAIDARGEEVVAELYDDADD